MKLLKMSELDQDTLYANLAAMSTFLDETFRGLTPAKACLSLSTDSFSPVEHCWHLADLEREAFSVRIRRLLEEENPWLQNFDGDRIAQERQYKRLSLADGITAFHESRLHNLALLQIIPPDSWTRQGEQEGVGTVMLCDIPTMMAEHDAAHKKEIEEWLRAVGD